MVIAAKDGRIIPLALLPLEIESNLLLAKLYAAKTPIKITIIAESEGICTLDYLDPGKDFHFSSKFSSRLMSSWMLVAISLYLRHCFIIVNHHCSEVKFNPLWKIK